MDTTPSKQNRQLAAILFADIVGYTALMQKDEALALQKIKRYQTVLESAGKEFNGQVLKNYGDGSLMIFSNSLDAVKAAKQIQEQARVEPTVPLRIGVHIGEFIVEKGDIYGNGVNLASRIESLGIEGAVLFSKNIFQKIKNYPELKIQSLGNFEFKNVEEPIEVFVLANEGFPIPKRAEMQGKLKTNSQDSNDSFFQKIWNKRIPQILTLYALGAWLGLQLFNWSLNHFGISPHWGDIFFITLIGIVPSLLLYLYNRDRIQQSQLKWGEQILFPVNFIGLGVVLFFTFRGVDLGATSQTFSFINPEGIKETHKILKTNFRQEIKLFPFEPIQEDSMSVAMMKTIPYGLFLELSQDKYLIPTINLTPIGSSENKFTTVEKINASKLSKGNFYIDGKYQVTSKNFEIIPAVRNKTTGKIIDQRTFKGHDFPSLMDSMSIYLRKAIGLNPNQIEESVDLHFRDYVGENLDAINLLVDNNPISLDQAIALDSTMALAYYRLIARSYRYSTAHLADKERIVQAMKYRKKLPPQYQIGIMAYYHLIHKEWKKAAQLLKIQLEITPDDPIINALLRQVYWNNFELDKLTDHAKKQYDNHPTTANEFQLMRVFLLNGEAAKVVAKMKSILQSDPKNIEALSFLAEAYIHQGKLGRAKETLDKVVLINPEIILNMEKLMEAVEYMKEHPTTPEFLARFVGTFRNSRGEMMFDVSIINNHIYFKAANQQGFFMYPAGENVVKYAVWGKGFQNELLFNKENQVHALKITENRKEIENIYQIWKQDSTIVNAEILLREGDYKNARTAYKNAISKHPQHFYLPLALKHLDYLDSKSEDAIQKNLHRIAGNYEDAELWENNGILYYKRPQGIRLFRPISDTQFISLSCYDLIYEFVDKNGEIIGVQVLLYDHKTAKWEIEKGYGYKEKTKFLD